MTRRSSCSWRWETSRGEAVANRRSSEAGANLRQLPQRECRGADAVGDGCGRARRGVPDGSDAGAEGAARGGTVVWAGVAIVGGGEGEGFGG